MLQSRYLFSDQGSPHLEGNLIRVKRDTHVQWSHWLLWSVETIVCSWVGDDSWSVNLNISSMGKVEKCIDYTVCSSYLYYNCPMGLNCLIHGHKAESASLAVVAEPAVSCGNPGISRSQRIFVGLWKVGWGLNNEVTEFCNKLRSAGDVNFTVTASHLSDVGIYLLTGLKKRKNANPWTQLKFGGGGACSSQGTTG